LRGARVSPRPGCRARLDRLLDLLYAQAAAARRRWHERHPESQRRLQQPVISIGNLSVGGTGKTPLVAAVARLLLARGERPAILSRGYGRRLRDVGVVVVSDGRRVCASLESSGDEPLMLANAIPDAIVAVCEDRHLAGSLAERQLGATVHVLDDGFQHLALARDLDVLVTSPGEITHGRVLPFGRLRERQDAAARAHLVVVVGADAAAARSEAWALGVSQSCGAARVLSLESRVVGLETGVLSLGSRVWRPAVAVAGIGDPEQFFEGLRNAGAEVRATRAFRDHHRYSTLDVRAIAELARAASVDTVLTTEKDAVRFAVLGALPFQLRAVPLTLVLDPPDPLAACVDTALARARNVA
jgi:tetraacyldisaccharide 4'-kinase